MNPLLEKIDDDFEALVADNRQIEEASKRIESSLLQMPENEFALIAKTMQVEIKDKASAAKIISTIITAGRIMLPLLGV